jgi:membrane associated rhomboid family serine protease
LFLHGGLLHLGGNMLFLWIFGDNVEDSMGHLRFIGFYFACGAAAALAQAVADPSAIEPMIGASGAIAGVLGAYILLHPRATVRTLIFLGFFVTIVRIPAAVVLGIWFLIQFWSALGAGTAEAQGVAFWAHVGGFVAGLILVPFLKRSEINLFQPPRSRPFARER